MANENLQEALNAISLKIFPAPASKTAFVARPTVVSLKEVHATFRHSFPLTFL